MYFEEYPSKDISLHFDQRIYPYSDTPENRSILSKDIYRILTTSLGDELIMGIIGNAETGTPSPCVIQPPMVMFLLLVELVNSDH